MPGPAPKPDSERRRRNAPTFEWTLLPESGRKGPIPKLPARTPDRRAWSAETRKWWNEIWRLPQATQWTATDASLRRLAWLQERVNRNEYIAAELGAIKDIEDRHGMSPKALMQLRWRIVPDAEILAASPAPARRGRKGSGPRRDYGHLKPVV